MAGQPRYGGGAYGGATRARESRPGGAIVVPGYDAAYFLTSTGRSAEYGGAAYGGRRQLTRPAAGIVALPDPAAGAVTLQWWWAYGDAVTIRRVEPDGTKVPVRGAEGASPAGPSLFNPSTNPRARDDLTGYSAGSNTTISRQENLTPGLVPQATTAVRGTATAAGSAWILAPSDAVAASPAVYGFEVQTSALASGLGLSVEWFDTASASLGSTTYLLSGADRSRAVDGLAWVTVPVATFPAGAVFGVLSYGAAGLAAGGWVQVTARLVVPGTVAPAASDYFDGDTLGAAYIGTSGVSYSRLGQVNALADAEAPLDAPVSYEMTCAAVPGWVVRTEQVTLDAEAVFTSSRSSWDTRRRALLTHPGQARTVRVWINDAPELEKDIREAKFKVRGRSNLVVVQAAQRDGYESSLDITTENADEFARLLAMFEVPSPMLLRLEANLQYPTVWWNSFGKLSIKPAERSGRVPLRKISVPITQVDRPTVAAAAIAV